MQCLHLNNDLRCLYWIIKSWGLCSIHTFSLWADLEVGNAVAALWENVVHEWSKSGEKAGKNKGKAFLEEDMFIYS